MDNAETCEVKSVIRFQFYFQVIHSEGNDAYYDVVTDELTGDTFFLDVNQFKEYSRNFPNHHLQGLITSLYPLYFDLRHLLQNYRIEFGHLVSNDIDETFPKIFETHQLN